MTGEAQAVVCGGSAGRSLRKAAWRRSCLRGGPKKWEVARLRFVWQGLGAQGGSPGWQGVVGTEPTVWQIQTQGSCLPPRDGDRGASPTLGATATVYLTKLLGPGGRTERRQLHTQVSQATAAAEPRPWAMLQCRRPVPGVTTGALRILARSGEAVQKLSCPRVHHSLIAPVPKN
jgi:hypothetical protein